MDRLIKWHSSLPILLKFIAEAACILLCFSGCHLKSAPHQIKPALAFHTFNTSPKAVLSVLKISDDLFYAVGSRSGGWLNVYRSQNSGETWQVDAEIPYNSLTGGQDLPDVEMRSSEDHRSIVLKLSTVTTVGKSSHTRQIRHAQFFATNSSHPWKRLDAGAALTHPALQSCIVLSDSLVYFADPKGIYLFNTLTDQTCSERPLLDTSSSSWINEVDLYASSQGIYCQHKRYDELANITNISLTVVPFAQDTAYTIDLKTMSPKIANAFTCLEYSDSGNVFQKLRIPTEFVMVGGDRVFAYTSFSSHNGKVSADTIFRESDFKKQNLPFKVFYDFDHRIIFSCANSIERFPDTFQFAFSNDSAASWCRFEIGGTVSRLIRSGTGQIYLLNGQGSLFGYCTPTDTGPEWSFKILSQDGPIINETYRYWNIDTSKVKVACSVYDKNLDTSYNVQFLSIPKSGLNTKFNGNEAEMRVDLTSLRYAVRDNDSLEIKYQISSPQYELSSAVTRLVYHSFTWRKYTNAIVVFFIVIGFYAILFLISIIHPFLLFQFYNSQLYPLLDKIPGKTGDIIKGINKAIFFNYFIANERVLKHWLTMNSEAILNEFLSNQAIAERKDYVMLPVVEKTSDGKVILTEKEPDLRFFDGLIHTIPVNKTLIQIIGVGGVGKSTLAFKIATEFSNEELLTKRHIPSKHLALPIFIQEETTDMVQLLKNKLEKATEIPINTDFFNVLLSKKRILIIIDALSEKSEISRNHVVDLINFDKRLANILITARRVIEVMSKSKTFYLFPEPISSQGLIPFSIEVLRQNGVTFLSKAAHQSLLAVKLSQIVAYDDKEVAITPILVNLALDPIVKFQQANTISADKVTNQLINEVLTLIPNSIPSLYSEYIKRLNKPFNGISIPGNDLLDIVEFLSYGCLSEEFTPREIDRDVLSNKFRTLNFQIFMDDGLAILESCGVLQLKKTAANVTLLAFILDPLCENFAAFYHAKECGRDVEKWAMLYAEILAVDNFPFGFAQLLLLVHKTYWKGKSWPNPSNLAAYSKVEGTVFDFHNGVSEPKVG